jgi:hypothetical protein
MERLSSSSGHKGQDIILVNMALSLTLIVLRLLLLRINQFLNCYQHKVTQIVTYWRVKNEQF